MNYNIDHNYLKEPLFKDLKGSQRYATLMVLSIIRHFTKNSKDHNVHFYSTQFAHDLGLTPKTISTAIKYLLDKKEIFCIKQYQRKGNQPAIYVAKRYITSSQKVYHDVTKGISRSDKVNNSKGIINQNNDDFNKSHSSSIVDAATPKPFKYPTEGKP